ncbi:enoyl-CoA hydratase/isomerase family protein [Mycobacteroides abscessus]|nr:enoyl-CoA hydratase/isomerase family protein [Mycobacteroides abscessus]MDM2427120.1 enoyl-CoA hydratase/isomerase family protein [Mycobacteroides abscessus]MDM2432213.1 enoyl-CoA hydratase/isomerase family protein [Mycobacteroides abscessus]MDM2436730.1 enoyl-CoA hydratase/isomerase family protein [Mycobacteroides abscessus]MDM2438660.1 enoyl-CoA hydratase/isomerase family protein [Mycobacteroides abscessus]
MGASIEYREKIAILSLGSDENRFSPEWITSVDALLDSVERDAQGLITTGEGKFFSNGLDLDWLMAHVDKADWYAGEVQGLLARLLTFPLPTVAAVNGHAFGAGAMLAIAHDYRVMRADRGYYCFPEIDMNFSFTPGMSALIQAKLTPQVAVKAMTTGHRYGGEEARAAGLVDDTVAEGAGVDAAAALLAGIVGKDAATLGAIKRTMYAGASAALREGLEQEHHGQLK